MFLRIFPGVPRFFEEIAAMRLTDWLDAVADMIHAAMVWLTADGFEDDDPIF
jgi:hypothetical protein